MASHQGLLQIAGMNTYEQLRKRLQDGGVKNAFQEARWMLQLAERNVTDEVELASLLEAWTCRRLAGEPFQYVVGSVEFYNIELAVGPGVLIPRPETELLVEHALQLLVDAPQDTEVLDLCTGSGAIPLALSHERPDLDYIGIDLSPEALKWAELNCAKLHPPHCHFLRGDLFAPLGQPHPRFHLITANPPYVSPDEYRKLPSEVKDFEPRLALEAKDDGLALEKRIADEARNHLLPGGWLLLEIGEMQALRIHDCLQVLGYEEIAILKDLSGRDRIAQGQYSLAREREPGGLRLGT
ncbi:MAG: peptide chain release factor N(5)-glutamine methyltransferase [Victivallales bacterium]|nr:peptide chain release factor N(5)-glutamine methyltransferase [Victivallales bacterium]